MERMAQQQEEQLMKDADHGSFITHDHQLMKDADHGSFITWIASQLTYLEPPRSIPPPMPRASWDLLGSYAVDNYWPWDRKHIPKPEPPKGKTYAPGLHPDYHVNKEHIQEQHCHYLATKPHKSISKSNTAVT